MKEIKTLEDFKSLLNKPIFKWMKHEHHGNVFVIQERTTENRDYIDGHKDINWDVSSSFTPIPKPLEITQENCLQWAKSSDAKDCEVNRDDFCWDLPGFWDYSKSVADYIVRDLMPTQAETEATEQPLEQRVRAWILEKRGE